MRLTYTLMDVEETALGRLTLHRYESPAGEVGYEVRIADRFLMASHGAHSERVMAALAADLLGRAPTHILVGGLGAGHTLRAALDRAPTARVTVVELGAKVVQWNRTYFAAVNGHAVADPRVQVVVGDLYDVLRAADGAFDVMLLDVDNGPGDLAAPENGRLYTQAGLAVTGRALAPDGVVAIWSPHANTALRDDLAAVFGEVRAVTTDAVGRPLAEPGDVIYLARAVNAIIGAAASPSSRDP